MTRETHHASNLALSFDRSRARQSIKTTAAVGLWMASAIVGAAQSPPAQRTFFGYAGRVSGGATSIGTVVESAADLSLLANWSVNGYIGRLLGGDVVRSLFADDRLTFFYVESVVGF